MNPQPEKTELEKKMEEEIAAQQARSAASPDGGLGSGAAFSDGEVPEEELPEMIPSIDVDALITERDELKNQLLRARAEFDNYRKRTAREAEQTRLRANESLLRDLLPVIDNLELAMQHAGVAEGPLVEGIQMVLRQFHDALRKAGVETIPSTGEAFDPAVHEAVMQAPSAEVAESHVAQEFQKGYRLGGYVLRPSKVVVSTGAPQEEAPDPQ